MKILTTYTFFKILIISTLLLNIPAFHTCAQERLTSRLDSLFDSPTQTPFNGVVLIAQKGRIIYSRISGFHDYENQNWLSIEDQFMLGSISKQFTAALVLQELDKGNLNLHMPIKKYLPELNMPWADSVTIHHLLNHTSGIVDLTKPLEFVPGSTFSYSAVLGYDLLKRIVEKTSGDTFEKAASDLFNKCKMKNTYLASQYIVGKLSNSYIEEESSNLKKQFVDLKNSQHWLGGGGIISSAEDLATWNQCLHKGKLLSRKSYKQMINISAQRSHPAWGDIGYGYGIQVQKKSGSAEFSHSGNWMGYNTTNLYLPKTDTSIIILSNIDWYDKTFFYHDMIYKIANNN